MAEFLGGDGAGVPSLGGPTMSFSGMTPLPGGVLGAAPTVSFGAVSDAPPAGLLQDPEEEILRRFQTLQRVRKAAGQAAQIADIDAVELRRLEAHAAAVLEAAGVPKKAIDRVRQQHQEQQQQAREDGQQPPAAAVPAMTQAAPAPQPWSEEQMQARAARVMDLGNFWAAQERGEATMDAAAAVAAAARQAGSFPALAVALRAHLAAAAAVEVREVAPGAAGGAPGAAGADQGMRPLEENPASEPI